MFGSTCVTCVTQLRIYACHFDPLRPTAPKATATRFLGQPQIVSKMFGSTCVTGVTQLRIYA
eukprot:5753225-Heterocapsa_arctica.AAC.1